jgi:hypothetical protein
VQKGYVDSENGMHPKHWHSRQLPASEIPSVESPVTPLLSPVTQSIAIKRMGLGLGWNLVHDHRTYVQSIGHQKQENMNIVLADM